MEMHELIEQAKQNIRVALEDYGRYGWQDVLQDVTSTFINNLAADSCMAKQGTASCSASPLFGTRSWTP